jgi:hypothetical protein
VNKTNSVIKGGCLCGAVAFEVSPPLRDIISCHCTQCQKSSGHYFAATAASRNNLKIKEDWGLKWYKSSNWAERGFCSECGANLFWRMPDRDAISILAGSLNGDTGLKTIRHIFVADKKDYYEICDGLPQFDTFPES